MDINSLKQGQELYHSVLHTVTIISNDVGNRSITVLSTKGDLSFSYRDFGKVLFLTKEHSDKFSNNKFASEIEYCEYCENEIICNNYEEEKKIEQQNAIQRKKYEILLKELESENEDSVRKNNFIALLKAIESADPNYNFEGLVHIASMENFLSIIKTGYLYPREVLEEKGILLRDDANADIIDKTNTSIKKCTRFYYREMTPTHIKANYCVPVIMVFDKNLMQEKYATFCSWSAAKKGFTATSSLEKARQYNWKAIMFRGPYLSDEQFENWKPYRNCDFLYNGEVPTSKIVKIYFKYDEDYQHAKRELGNLLDDKIVEISAKKFYKIADYRNG